MPTPYDVITENIIKRLEAGIVPWHRPWVGSQNAPTNLVSRKPYRGINPLILASAGYASPFWLTFKQAQSLKGSVRKGEHGQKIVFWNVGEREKTDGSKERSFLLRYYTVFNALQCDGLTIPELETRTNNPILTAENIALGYSGPTLDWTSSGAWYRPATDHISMPPKATFKSSEAIYATLFHEMGHSTGHASRLNREGIAKHNGFGSELYSKEELIAEMTSAFLCADAGIDTEGILDNSAAYLASWIKVLKGDSKLIVSAAAGAQKAAGLILGPGAEELDSDTEAAE